MTNMMSSTQSPATPESKPFNERLTGERILDAQGNPAQPSNALPFESDSPVPTMLVERELNYLHWLACNLEGTGRVVELGCFLGGSTSALAAGLRLNNPSTKPILTYDAFHTPPMDQPHLIAWLGSYGLKPDQRFRDQFDQYNRDWLDQLIIRDGWIPENVTLEQELEQYPEQEPIELLFIDAAKTWDVHLSILRTFARHLQADATLVQQDFFDVETPWIPLHMWQLRDVLEPMDVILGTPTVSFRCKDNLNEHLSQPSALTDLADSSLRDQVWSDILEYWSDLIGVNAAGFIYGHAAKHSILAGDGDGAARWGRLYESWIRSSHSTKVYVTPGWDGVISMMPKALAQHDGLTKSACIFSAELAIGNRRPDRKHPRDRSPSYPAEQRINVWNTTLARLEESNHFQIAIFGAGKHTDWLLSSFRLQDRIRVSCIIDDSPSTDSICGIPVLSPHDSKPILMEASAIIPSSDSFEPQILNRMTSLFSDSFNGELISVYTHPDEQDSLSREWRYTVHPSRNYTPQEHDRPKHKIISSTQERLLLGLQPDRPWANECATRYAVPDWVDGYIDFADVVFLWDLIESIRPNNIVEIGTASGVSTALLLAGIEQFCDQRAQVHSFDIATRCYFDPLRPLGSAIGEMASDLIDRACLYAQADASDAASCFAPGEVDFAFIDGDHAHPSTTLDLLSLIYALRPGAWVALHDIELSKMHPHLNEIPGQGTTGPERLFQAWPFEKIQPAGDRPEQKNIGAIRMPEHVADAIPHLLSLLRGPWETFAKPNPEFASALDQLTEIGG